MTKWQKAQKALYKNLCRELNKIGNYKFVYSYDKTSDRHSVDLVGSIPITVIPKSYSGYYSFYLRHNLPYVKTYALEKNYTAPNNVGVLTKNKIKAWVEYLTVLYEAQVARSKKLQANVTGHLAQMDKIGCKYAKGYNSQYSGYIEKNGIKYSFEISSEGYISEKLSLAYHYKENENTVSRFLKLADNMTA